MPSFSNTEQTKEVSLQTAMPKSFMTSALGVLVHTAAAASSSLDTVGNTDTPPRRRPQTTEQRDETPNDITISSPGERYNGLPHPTHGGEVPSPPVLSVVQLHHPHQHGPPASLHHIAPPVNAIMDPHHHPPAHYHHQPVHYGPPTYWPAYPGYVRVPPLPPPMPPHSHLPHAPHTVSPHHPYYARYAESRHIYCAPHPTHYTPIVSPPNANSTSPIIHRLAQPISASSSPADRASKSLYRSHRHQQTEEDGDGDSSNSVDRDEESTAKNESSPFKRVHPWENGPKTKMNCYALRFN